MTTKQLFNECKNGLRQLQYVMKIFEDTNFEEFFIQTKGNDLQQEELKDIKFFFNKDNLILEYPKKIMKYFPIGLVPNADWEEKDGMLIIYTDKDVLVYDLQSRKVGIDRIFNKKW